MKLKEENNTLMRKVTELQSQNLKLKRKLVVAASRSVVVSPEVLGASKSKVRSGKENDKECVTGGSATAKVIGTPSPENKKRASFRSPGKRLIFLNRRLSS